MNKKQIRSNFRREVFERDGNKCVICKATKALDAHHITNRNEMSNGGYVKENGISLCPDCHKKAEAWYQSGKGLSDYRSVNLYKLINSSYELALEKCTNDQIN